MIDHVSVPVSDFERSLAFYTAALAPLGYTALRRYPGVAGLGVDGKPDVWLQQRDRVAPFHLALATRSAHVVRAFHAAALAAGGTDNGAPGLRAQYHPSYFGAFVLDPDGHNLEVVCHGGDQPPNS